MVESPMLQTKYALERRLHMYMTLRKTDGTMRHTSQDILETKLELEKHTASLQANHVDLA